MQRYSGGLEVPLLMMDVFSGKSTDAGGDLECELTYEPRSLNHISVSAGVNIAGDALRLYDALSITGKTLTVKVRKIKYWKADTPVGSSNSGGAGADPHDHTISYSIDICGVADVVTEAQPPLIVHYEVA